MKIIRFALSISGPLFLFAFISCSTEKQTETVEWSRNATIYEVNIRQFTPEGTFNAFKKHLPRLSNMGVKILWFMPIQPIGEINRKGTLGSYYSIKDYTAINPEFGSETDFREVVKAAHDLGMYVILDWVANHTAWDHEWTKSNPSYYTKDSLGNFIPPVADWSDVIDLNYENLELREKMIHAMEFWIKEFDLDGFRCDVAAMVPLDFWQKTRERLFSIKPVFMLAEASEPELHEKAFDMTYNWQLKDIMNNIARGKTNNDALRQHFSDETKNYPDHALRMTFTSNHDENSWHKTAFERLGKNFEAFTVLTFTVNGMPLIYSGQESGSEKSLRFFDKDTINWAGYKYVSLYKKLCQLKTEHTSLKNRPSASSIKLLDTGFNDEVFVFMREANSERLLVMLNFSDSEKQFNLGSSEADGNYKEIFTDSYWELSKDKMIMIPENGYYVFTTDTK